MSAAEVRDPPRVASRRQRLGWVLAEARDRLRASDPGLGRLRAGLSAAVCVGTTLPLEAAVARTLGYPSRAAFAAMLFGAVVAMLGSNALVGPERWGKVGNAAFFPVAVGLGLTLAVLTDGQRLLQVLGFAAVLFAAVWVRRFGPRFFFYGFMAWMGFFFATFLQATWALVPMLLLAAVVATVWTLLLTMTVFRADPRRVLRSTLGAFFGQARSVARESADLLAVPAGAEGARRRATRVLASRRAGLGDVALMAEAWSAERGAVPTGWSAAALRRRLLETQQATERMAGTAERLAAAVADGHDVDPDLLEVAALMLDHVAHHRDVAALVAADRLEALATEHERSGRPGWWSARHLAFAAREFLRFDAAVDDPPQVDPGEEEFEAATGLVFGSLPGAPAVARDVAARTFAWNPVRHVSLTTRQAVQVALAGVLALGAGTLLSPTRYYWAVIAAFVTFTGTATRTETFLKGSSRISGTLAGLVAAILLAHVTAGHSVAVFAVILTCIFFAFYLQRVSATAMAFFITLLLGQLYVVLGTFTDALLALRLGETVVGAVAGVTVALLFAPLSTRDAVRAVRDDLYASMADFLDGAAAYADGERVDLDALARRLDDRGRRLGVVARPLTRQLVLGNGSPRTRRRLGLMVAAVSQCRALDVSLQRLPVADAEATAAACRSLAEAVRRMGRREVGEATPDAEDPLRRSDLALFSDPRHDRDADPVVRHLHHLVATLSELAETPLRPDVIAT